jgi:hypothetical protein
MIDPEFKKLRTPSPLDDECTEELTGSSAHQQRSPELLPRGNGENSARPAS